MTANECVRDVQAKLLNSVTVERERQRAEALVSGETDTIMLLKKSMRSRNQFHASFYVSISATNKISVRVKGAVVGTVTFKSGVPKFTGGELKDENWNSNAVLALIRSHSDRKIPLAEKNVEAALLTMLEEDRAPGHPLRRHAAVKYPHAGLRIQFPNPASPRGGNNTGHVDILARRGTGRGSVLRVLELKKPGRVDVRKTLEQAIAYCVGIVEARSEALWKLYGYAKGTPPSSLEATAVVEKNGTCSSEACQSVLSQMGTAKIGGFDLSLSVLLYTFNDKGNLILAEVPRAGQSTLNRGK
ncbi:MAG: hypothetical protein SF187_23740 [Deltaproteobacteria bacterium]|nr:hypothetical protein [Deltaproteobacteria bacterium]